MFGSGFAGVPATVEITTNRTADELQQVPQGFSNTTSVAAVSPLPDETRFNFRRDLLDCLHSDVFLIFRETLQGFEPIDSRFVAGCGYMYRAFT
ncbi:hypothetical protein BFC21_10290 [Pseudomonas sp. TMW 2.1634]|nr:hypothetical protein BFC21_10290 [Pseudomonas sp. TMW 2.1634]